MDLSVGVLVSSGDLLALHTSHSTSPERKLEFR